MLVAKPGITLRLVTGEVAHRRAERSHRVIPFRISTRPCLLASLCFAVVACGSSPNNGDDGDDTHHSTGGSGASGGTTPLGGTGAASGSGGTSSSGGSAGTPASDTCNQTCQADGFATGTSSGNHCTCDTPTDAQCSQAMQAFCFCLATLEPPPCTAQDQFNDYVACHTNLGGFRSGFLCVNGYVSGNQVDCNGAQSCF